MKYRKLPVVIEACGRLPVGSVVATSTDVFIRVTARDDAGWHAACSDGGMYGFRSGWVEGLLISGLATVLRVGPEPADRYDRAVLVNVLVYHHRVPDRSCLCGWAEVGRSLFEHVADVYEECICTVTSGNDYPATDNECEAE